MPELPEVEVTRQAILTQVGQQIEKVVINTPSLRWPIPIALSHCLPGQTLLGVSRRAKYLMLQFEAGWLILHLGMSGCLRFMPTDTPLQKHDHFELLLSNSTVMRLNDPRRFGAVLWTDDWQSHRLFINLGVEPLSAAFTGAYLFKQAKNKKLPIKSFIMDQKNVVGVGNIYANESLFLAKIAPTVAAGELTKPVLQTLAKQIKFVLSNAIKQGGTTLKDFAKPDGKPGYFKQALQIYGRGGKPCFVCQSEIILMQQAGRQTVFCPSCQGNYIA